MATTALVITACSNAVPSDSETIVLEPDRVFNSDKTAEVVSACIEDKWGAWINRFEDWGVIQTDTINGVYNISALKYGIEAYDGAPLRPSTKNYSADVSSSATGSETKLYQYFSLNLGTNPFFAIVDQCQ